MEYGKYKSFDDQELLKDEIYQNNEEIYSIFARIFQSYFNNHAPIKQKKEEIMLALRLKILVTR